MRLLVLSLAAAALTASTALAYDLSLVQQLVGSPAVQQQMAQTVAANPQLATSMFGNLSPAQTQAFTTQLNAAVTKLLTPAERAKLTQFQASPEGAGIIAKLPQIAEQMAPVLMQLYLSPTGAAPAAGAAAPLKLTPPSK